MSDYYMAGVSSVAHLADRIVAPLVFLLTVWTIGSDFGVRWASACSFPVACYAMSVRSIKKGRYESYIFWHSMWHFVGQGALIICMAGQEYNGLDRYVS